MVISYGSHCPCRLARLFAISDGMRWNITESGPLPEQYVGTLTGKHSLNINYDLDPNPEAETAPSARLSDFVPASFFMLSHKLKIAQNLVD